MKPKCLRDNEIRPNKSTDQTVLIVFYRTVDDYIETITRDET